MDGNTLYGILYYPANYEPGRRYRLVAEIYEQFFDNGFNENMNLMTARGWFGFRPSVRFEEGFPGEAWLKAVPNAINKIIERGLVDPDKVGVHGQSYGGYATNLLITQTDHFAAAANVSGKVNIISFLGDSPKITTRNYAAAEVGQDRIGATLWEQPHKYIEHSGGDVRGQDRDAAAHAVRRRRLECAGHQPTRRSWMSPPSALCGWLDDRFGVSWQVIPANMDELMSADPKRVMEPLLTMGRVDISALKEAGSQG